MKTVTVNDIVSLFNKIANFSIAENWDNVGLLLGDQNKNVEKILLSLDLTEKCVIKAIENKVDMIITHHPIIFQAQKKITKPTFINLIKNDISVLSLHTNFDSITDGVNKALADKLNLKDLSFIQSNDQTKLYRVSINLPEKNLKQMKDAIFAAGAGIVHNYNNCAHQFHVTGQFQGNDETNPFIGEPNKLEVVEEIRFEFEVEKFKLQKIIQTIEAHHPYETPTYAIYPLSQNSKNYGLGYFGELETAISLEEFANNVKLNLKAPFIKLWTGNKSKSSKVKRIAICGGSGSSLIPKVIGICDAFVSADFTYHTILDCPIPLIDAGHFYTEQPVLEKFEKYLNAFDLKIIHFTAQEHEINNLTII